MIKKAYTKGKQLVVRCDLFSNSQLLRYGQEPQYKSAHGGLCSIAILITFIVVFMNTVISTINMTNISSITTLFEEADPSVFQTTTQGILFAIGISNFNLTNTNTKYFDIEIMQKISNPASINNFTLVPCSRSVWTQNYPDFGNTFDRLQLQSWLCLPPNTKLKFQGKYTSNIFQYVRIGVKRCSSTVGDNRTCVSQSYIDNMIETSGPISFNYYFMNTIINANSQQYMGSYLQDRNYFTFTMKTASNVNIFISPYDIQSDVSLLPTINTVQDTGGMVYEPTQIFVQEVNTGNPYYILLHLRKSSLSISIKRSFFKYDACLSYIGGLFSCIMTIIAFMSLYNEAAYQIDVTSSIFKQTSTTNIKSAYFNMFTYLAYLFYKIVHFFGVNPGWNLIKQFDTAREEISKQLNIKLIIKKIGFLENCMEYLFEDFQLKCLHLKDKLSLKQAAQNRKRFSFRPRLLKFKRNKQNKECQKQGQLKKQGFQNQIETSNKERINVKNSSVKMQSLDNQKNAQQIQQTGSFDFNNTLRIKNQDNAKFKLEQKDTIEELQDGADNISSQSESSQKQFYDQMLNSLQHLQFEAKRGRRRCAKIYNSLDGVVKQIAQTPYNQESSFAEEEIKQAAKQSQISKNIAPQFIFDMENQDL